MVGLLSSVDGLQSLNESPHPKAGKCDTKRERRENQRGLNESPHPKAGKSGSPRIDVQSCVSPQ